MREDNEWAFLNCWEKKYLSHGIPYLEKIFSKMKAKENKSWKNVASRTALQEIVKNFFSIKRVPHGNLDLY